MSTRSRRLLWALSVIVAFILGFLLARWLCRRDMAGSGGIGAERVVGQGAPSQSAPSRIKLGGGQGNVSSQAGHSNGIDGGVDSGNGGGGNGGGGEAEGGYGGGSGVIPGGSGVFKKSPHATDSLFGNFVARQTEDIESSGSHTDSVGQDPNVITRVAHDFSLDGTGLPRYASGVTRVLSSLAIRTDVPGDSSTGAGIETNESFQTVAAWYHDHMPPGWKETSVGNLQQIASRYTVQNIGKMLMSATSADSQPPSDSSGAGGGPSVTVWSAPDNGPHGKRQVMVVAEPGSPIQILMTRAVHP